MNLIPLMEWWYGGAWVAVLPLIAIALTVYIVSRLSRKRPNDKQGTDK